MKLDCAIKDRLAGKLSDFSTSQRRLRLLYLERLEREELPAPSKQWFDQNDPGSNLATSIYNSLVDDFYSDRIGSPEDRCCWMAAGLTDLIATGGDAELWTRLRVALDESHTHYAGPWADRGSYIDTERGQNSLRQYRKWSESNHILSIHNKNFPFTSRGPKPWRGSRRRGWHRDR